MASLWKASTPKTPTKQDEKFEQAKKKTQQAAQKDRDKHEKPSSGQ